MKVNCPHCNKELDGNEMLDGSKIEFILDGIVGFSYECPHCGGLVLFESTTAFYHNGRRFLEFPNLSKED